MLSLRLVLPCLICLLFVLTAQVAASPEVTAQARRFIEDHEKRLKPLDVVANEAWWQASTTGSTDYCLTSKTGNCTDFHSLYMSLSRASGIPTRITYGSFLKGPLAGADKDQSYHCWLEFLAPGVGHYGIFSGRRWRELIYPRVREFIAKHS